MLLRVCTALLLTLGPVPAVSLRPASVTACSTLTPCCERTTFLHHHAPAAAAYICFGTCPSHATLFNIAPEVLPTGAACYRSGVAYKRMHAPRSNPAAQPALPRAAGLAFPSACMRSLSNRRCLWACLRRQRSCLLQLSSSVCTFTVRSLPSLSYWHQHYTFQPSLLQLHPKLKLFCLSVHTRDGCGLCFQGKPHVALRTLPPCSLLTSVSMCSFCLCCFAALALQTLCGLQ